MIWPDRLGWKRSAVPEISNARPLRRLSASRKLLNAAVAHLLRRTRGSPEGAAGGAIGARIADYVTLPTRATTNSTAVAFALKGSIDQSFRGRDGEEGTKPKSGERFAFVDVIRAAAAIMVLIAHFVELYLYQPAIVAAAISAPPPTTVGLAWLSVILHPANFGGLGVALFFWRPASWLMAVARRTRGRHLIDRLFRIYPTWFAAFVLSCGALRLSQAVGASRLCHMGRSIRRQSPAGPDLLFRPAIVGPLWTLGSIQVLRPRRAFATPLRRGALWPAWVWGVATFCAPAPASACRRGTTMIASWLRQSLPFASWGGDVRHVLLHWGSLLRAHWIRTVAHRPRRFISGPRYLRYLLRPSRSRRVFARRSPSAAWTFLLATGDLLPHATALCLRIGSVPLIDLSSRVSVSLCTLHMLVGFVLLAFWNMSAFPSSLIAGYVRRRVCARLVDRRPRRTTRHWTPATN